jgi:hypothetical protein
MKLAVETASSGTWSGIAADESAAISIRLIIYWIMFYGPIG